MSKSAHSISALSFPWQTPLYECTQTRGQLIVLDIGAPHTSLASFIASYMHRLEEAADHFDGLIQQFIEEAGFGFVKETEHFLTLFGPLSYGRL